MEYHRHFQRYYYFHDPGKNMTLSEDQKHRMIQLNKGEYGRSIEALSWLPQEKILKATTHRERLLDSIRQHCEEGAGGTKVNMGGLSPGCRICVEGKWSCLFINGRCNGKCFYCPTPQDQVGQPVTNGLTFISPEDYVPLIWKTSVLRG